MYWKTCLTTLQNQKLTFDLQEVVHGEVGVLPVHVPLAILGQLDGDHEEGEALGQGLAAGDHVVR